MIISQLMKDVFQKLEANILNSETQRLVQNVIFKLEKIKMVFEKPVMVKYPCRMNKICQTRHGYVCDTYVTFW